MLSIWIFDLTLTDNLDFSSKEKEYTYEIRQLNHIPFKIMSNDKRLLQPNRKTDKQTGQNSINQLNRTCI